MFEQTSLLNSEQKCKVSTALKKHVSNYVKKMYESFEEPNNRWKHIFDLANKEITFLLHAMTVCNKTR